MPLIDSEDEQVWRDLYTGGFVRERKDLILGCNGLPFGHGDHFSLKNALDLRPGQSIALVGAGFGWIAEDWTAAGLGPIIALDTSTWIHANLETNAVFPIIAEDGLTPESRANILSYFKTQKIDWAITEDVLPVLTDQECVDLDAAMREYAANVAHWVSVGCKNPDGDWTGDSRLNWKLLEDWKDLVPNSLVVQRGTDRVM